MRLGAGDRGQAIQIGAVILFGFAVIAFAGYQAVAVPDQNQEVEFRHSMQMTDQMQEFRTDVIEAASTGATRSQAFKLGTDYPVRLFAVNPPPASGQLSTTTFGGGEYVLDAPGASLEDICGLSGGTGNSVDSKALVYEPNYNEYTQAPDIVYENTVTYRQFPGEVRLDSGQNLIDGKTLTLTPLVGDVSESTSATRTVDVAPGKAGIGATDSGTVTLTVPTALDAGTWEDLLESELDENGGRVESVDPAPAGGVEITLASASYTVICPPVGLESAPDNEPSDVIRRSGDGSGSLNPGDAGEVRLTDIERDTDDSDVIVLTFENSGDAVNLTTGRFNFYDDPNGDGPDRVDVFNYTEYGTDSSDSNARMADVGLRGRTASSDPQQVVAGGGSTTQVALRFEDSSGAFNTQDSDFAVVEFAYNTSQESLYFIDMPKQGDTAGNDPPTASFTYSPTNPGTSEQVDFDASGSTDPDDNSLTYSWDFGDDTQGTGVSPSHTYSNSQDYTVTLTVEDPDGATDTTTQTVSVVSAGSPSIDTFDVTDTSGSNTASYSVDWAVSDPDENLESVTIYLNRTSGQTDDTFTTTVSGGSASGMDTVSQNGGEGREYNIVLQVTDADGNTVRRTVTDNADGTNP